MLQQNSRCRPLAAGALVFGLTMAAGGPPVAAQDAAAAPEYRVDPFWPRPLPNDWILGQVAGVAVDSRDHVWIIQRPGSLSEREVGASLEPPISKCCIAAPPVLVFDAEGNLLRRWGGPGEGYDWPENEHGIYVDAEDNVWIGGNGENDHQILKFTLDGEFLMQIGEAGVSNGSNDTESLGRPADVTVDTEADEIYVADGYGNKRVIVFDTETGAYKRHWGAYGNEPSDADLGPYDPDKPPAEQFRNPVHCVNFTDDGRLYVCDRVNDRYQVFEKDGAFVEEHFFEPQTLLNGSVSDLTFSNDAGQTYIFMVDGVNNEARVVERESGEVLSTFGRPGRYAGQFHVVHDVAIDSSNNLYTTEVNTGQRVQKFVQVEE
jgi:DNA-binding beta-propeller fold protein YncE